MGIEERTLYVGSDGNAYETKGEALRTFGFDTAEGVPYLLEASIQTVKRCTADFGKRQSIAVFVNGEQLPDAKTFQGFVPAIPNGVSNGALCFLPGKPVYIVQDEYGYLLVATEKKPTIDRTDTVTSIRFDIAESVERSLVDNAEIWREMAGVRVWEYETQLWNS